MRCMVCGEEMCLVQAVPDGYHELGRVKRAIQGSRCWNVPALANGRILIRNEMEMACFNLRE